MTSDQVIEALTKAILDKNQDVSIEEYENTLSKSIEDISTNEKFFSLPLENILRIIENSETDDIEVLCSLTKSMSEYKGKQATLILNVIDSDEGSMSDYIEILSNLKCCPICKRISDICERNKNLPTIDYPKKISELQDEINSLKKSLQNKSAKNTNKPEKKPPQKQNKPAKNKKPDSIFNAAGKGDMQRVTEFIKGGGNVNIKDEHQESLLHWAANYNKMKIVQFLVSNGADVNSVNVRNETPLHMCARRGHFQIVTFLVEHGSNVHIKNTNGYTPKILAQQNFSKRIVDFLQEKE